MLRLQTRLLSLLRNGGAPPLLTCTNTSLHRHFSATASTSPFAAEDYLVAACGLTRAQALKASKELSHLRSPSNSDAVLSFL
jgi:mTERF domain-containing protein